MKIEAKNIIYLPERIVGEDIHIVKEVQYENGLYKDNIKIIKDFKRPFWITKPIYRNYTEKKESEELSKVDKFMSTESNLYKNIARRLGERYIGMTNPRILKQSPYLYGTDVDSRTILKYMYMRKYNNFIAPNRYGVFDIEVNTLTNEIILISIVTAKKLKVAILKIFVKGIPDLENKINQQYAKYIPECEFKNTVDREYRIFDTQLEAIRWIFQSANYMDIDILAAWNIKYDIGEIVDYLESQNVNPAEIFHYDKIPKKYMYFNLKEAKSKKITEAGREIPVSPEEQWHVITTTSNYKLLDAMATHRYIRVGGATVPGGYGLDNILGHEGVAKKLKYDSNQGFKGIEWHMNMVANKPVEYIIYNIWDVMSMLVLDKKTKDIEVSLGLLAEVSHLDIFNSGPRRIVDALLFFYLSRGRVLGVKDPTEENNKILGLGGWVLTLRAHLMEDNGLRRTDAGDWIHTNIRTYVADADAVSSYPSNTRAANVSKDTTHREVVKISGLNRNDFILQNINLMYGRTNSIQYCRTMFKMPDFYTLYKEVS